MPIRPACAHHGRESRERRVRGGGVLGRGWSLRARFVMVAVACLAPLVIVVLFVLYESVGNGRDQLLEAQSATVEVVAKVVAATLDDNTRVLNEIGSIDKVRRLDANSAGDVL